MDRENNRWLQPYTHFVRVTSSRSLQQTDPTIAISVTHPTVLRHFESCDYKVQFIMKMIEICVIPLTRLDTLVSLSMISEFTKFMDKHHVQDQVFTNVKTDDGILALTCTAVLYHECSTR